MRKSPRLGWGPKASPGSAEGGSTQQAHLIEGRHQGVVERAGLKQIVAGLRVVNVGEHVIVAEDVNLCRVIAQACGAAEVRDSLGGDVLVRGADARDDRSLLSGFMALSSVTVRLRHPNFYHRAVNPSLFLSQK
jgi:hypothetical protein